MGYLERGQTDVIQNLFDPAMPDLDKAIELSPMARSPTSSAVLLRLGEAMSTRRSRISQRQSKRVRMIRKIYDRRGFAKRSLKKLGRGAG